MGAWKWPQSSALSLLLFTGGPKWAVRINRSYWVKTNKKRFDTNSNRKFDLFCVIKNNDFQYTTQNGWMIAILVTLLLLVIPNWARFLVGGLALGPANSKRVNNPFPWPCRCFSTFRGWIIENAYFISVVFYNISL